MFRFASPLPVYRSSRKVSISPARSAKYIQSHVSHARARPLSCSLRFSKCWCGGADADHDQHGESTGCTTPCPGNDDETCGGAWSVDVYRFGDPAPPPPTPPTPTPPFACGTLDGVLNKERGACCAKSCGRCGGKGCNKRGNGRHECCTGAIREDGDLCSVTRAAPCIMD